MSKPLALIIFLFSAQVMAGYTAEPLDCTQNVEICDQFGATVDPTGLKTVGHYTYGGKEVSYYGSTTLSYPGAWNNRAEGVNNAGVVAGYSQVRTKPLLGFRSPLKTVSWLWSEQAGFFKTFAGYGLVVDVNDGNEVLSTGDHAVYAANGVKTQLPIMPNTYGTWLYVIDNNGDVYGKVRTSSTAYTYANVAYRKN